MDGGEGVDSGRPEGSEIGSGRFGENKSGRIGEFGSGRVYPEIGGNTHQSYTGSPNWRFKKLDLPTFEGTNPDGWILRAERYFKFYRLTEEEQVEAAVVSLDGDALLWYQWEHGRRPIRHWEELKGMLLRQFRRTSSGSLYEQWLNHDQTSDVVEYRRRFIELMAPLVGVPEEITKGQYINGLKHDVRAEVRLLGPRSLDHAMDLSIKVEDKLKSGFILKGDSKRASSSSSYSGNSAYSSFHNQSSSYSPSTRTTSMFSHTSSSPSYGTGTLPVAKPIEVRRLSEKELQSKREKGECFRCDEKWSAGHRYK